MAVNDKEAAVFDGLYVSPDPEDGMIRYCLFVEDKYQCVFAFSVENSKSLLAMLETAIRAMESAKTRPANG